MSDPKLWGLAFGLLGALCQALNYALTKFCQEKHGLRGMHLLIACHGFMFLLSIAPFLINKSWRYADAGVFMWIAAVIFPYLLAQYLCNAAIAASDSSLVSPLLTLKIPVLALISVFVLGQSFNAFQTAAVVLIVSLGWYFSSLAGRISLKPMLLVAGTVLCYCLSDLSMVQFMKHLAATYNAGRADQIITGVTYEYVLCGLILFPFGIAGKWRTTPSDIWHTGGVATLWVLSVYFFVACFNLDGVVAGNIVQSLRSVIGVVIAYVFYRKYIRDHASFRKKLMIAAGMFFAVGLYYA